MKKIALYIGLAVLMLIIISSITPAEKNTGLGNVPGNILNDGTVAGLEYKNVKAFSTAFCPYVLPGPMDTQYLYGKFEDMMEGK